MAAARKNSRKSVTAPVIQNMSETADVSTVEPTVGSFDVESTDATISALLAELNLADDVSVGQVEEIIEPVMLTPIDVEIEHTAEDINLAGAALDAMEIAVDAATAESGDNAAAPVSTDPEAIAATLAETEPGPTAETAVKEKKVTVPRKHYTDKSERLKDRMGASLSEFTVLTVDAVADTPEDLKARMDETMELIKKMSSKKQNRAGAMIEFIAGKKAAPNAPLLHSIRSLQRDGFITTGKESNLMTAMLGDGYTLASARAMGGNTIAVLEDLKLIKEEGKTRYVANPDSTLLGVLLAKVAALPAGAAPAKEDAAA